MSYFSDASLVFIPSAQKSGKAYSVKPTDGTGDLTFTRSNDTATRVGPDGLIEKVRTNLLTYSQDFSTARGWGGSGITATANYGTAPDGTTTSTQIVFSSVNQIWRKNAGVTGVYGNFNLYIKGTAGQTIQITYGQIADKLVTLTGSWTRFTSNAGTAVGPEIFINTFGGATALNVEVWGGQVETGDIETDYIATTTAAVSVGPVANVPRLDYLNSSCPRLLLEPQRTNLVTYSESFDNAAWSKSAVTITANDITSPDGYTNADKMVESATTSGHYILQSPTLTAAAYTFTIFAKAGERNWFLFRQHTLGLNASFNLATGTLGTIQSGLTATIEDYGNDWYRCSVTFTGTAAAHSFRLYVTTADNSTSSYLGDGTSGLYLYGAQCELGSYPSSYIPTLGAAVTRGADAATKTGISSLIGQTEGTFFLDIKPFDVGPNVALRLSDGTNNNRVTFEWSGAKTPVFVVGSGGTLQVYAPVTCALGVRHKIAMAYKANDFRIYIDGVLAASDTSGAVPLNLSEFRFGEVATFDFNGEVNQALLFKTRLTNAQLAELTTI